MLTDDDLQQIAMLLESYGLEKVTDRKRSLNAERQRRFRERNAVRNAEVTLPRAKRNAKSNAIVTHSGNETPTKATWAAYSTAYHDRYHVDPKWNGGVGGMVKNFIGKIGAEEAPHVAAFYLTHNGHFYVREMHPIRIMVRDAEKLRTEWATNRTITETQARQVDKTAALGNVFRELKEEIKHGPH